MMDHWGANKNRSIDPRELYFSHKSCSNTLYGMCVASVLKAISGGGWFWIWD